MLQRGVRYQVIYDSEALEWPGMLDGVLRCMEAGERARTHTRVPMKLIIGDRTLALVTLAREPAGKVEGALIVHPSNLLDGLCSLWDAYWEQAVRLQVGVDPSRAASRSSAREEQLMVLLAAGLKASVIARQLGVGSRARSRGGRSN